MMGFEPVRQVAAIMRGFERPWFVAGGWALDLSLGRETREHEDIEIAILRRDQEALCRFFSGWEMEKIVPGAGDSKRQPWRGEWLPPPIHEIHVRRVLWMFVGSWIQVTPDGHLRELEVLLDEAWADTWRFRRNLAVNRPLAEIVLRSSEGVPFLVPEIVLLYKAKDPRPRDERDFASVSPTLEAGRRQWLADALATVHPGHPWIVALSPPTTRQSS